MLINKSGQIQEARSLTQWNHSIEYSNIWFFVSYNSDVDDTINFTVCTPTSDQQKQLDNPSVNFNGNPDRFIPIDHYRFRFNSSAIEQIEFIVLSLLSLKLKQPESISLKSSQYKEFVHFFLDNCLGDIIITDLKAEINDNRMPVLIGSGLDCHSEMDFNKKKTERDFNEKTINYQFNLEFNISHLTTLVHLLDCLYILKKYQDECNELD